MHVKMRHISLCISQVFVLACLGGANADSNLFDTGLNSAVTSDGSLVVSPLFSKRSSGIVALSRPSQGKPFGLDYDGGSNLEISEWEINKINELRPPLMPDLTPRSRLQEKVIRIDTRVKIDPYDSADNHSYPATAVALIRFKRNGENYRCSGAFIGKDTVITAGHCLHTGGPDGQWSKSVKVYPAYSQGNNPVKPYGECEKKKLLSFSGWTKNSNPSYDIGSIKLNCSKGNKTGWFGYKAVDNLKDYPAIITGYPSDKPETDQWMGVDNIEEVLGSVIRYKADTYGGMSGSPVWYDDGRGPYIYGVHTRGGQSGNSGVRITKSTFETFSSWVAND